MVKVLFVCLGNICRSPMAEYILREKVSESGQADKFFVDSAGISAEEEGNPVYPPARMELAKHGIICENKRARHLSREDYAAFDYILCMEQWHAQRARTIFGGDPQKKIFRLLDFSISSHDIQDPWYTRDFVSAYREIEGGISDFLYYLQTQQKNRERN